MRILQLCKKFPYPLKDGETIAISYLSKAMHELGCEITLLCMNTSKHYSDISKMPAEFDHYKEIHFTELDNKVNAIGALANLFTKDSYHVSRFISDEFSAKLISLLRNKEYDVVQLETLYLAPYVDIIRANSDAIITMRAHNVEHEIWERITENTRLLPKKWYLGYLTRKLKRFELNRLNDYDYLIAVTEKDLKKFKDLGYKNGAIASPIGLDAEHYEGIPLKKQPLRSACFIGSLDWMPNMEGLQWFLEMVWPVVHDVFPDFELHVAGRNTPESLKRLNIKHVNIHGEVANAVDFISQHPIMVVPLFSGSGMRVKILEGMALGKIVITTTLGLEGIHAKHKQEVLIADNPEAFLDCIRFCIEKPEEVLEMSSNAIEFVETHYNNRQNAIALLSTYQELVNNPYPQPS